jgi:hypothetical protein
MKTLIIHPKDSTTTFLRSIYKDIQYKTLITGGCSYDDVIEEIKNHQRIIMCGHGCPYGLFGVGQFGKGGGLIINKNSVPYLKGKECVYIWCNSDQFVERYELNGFYSGMFISEVGESFMCGFRGITQSEVSSSNYSFSSIVGKHIHKPLNEVYENVRNEYGVLCDTNPIAEYNHERLYYN